MNWTLIVIELILLTIAVLAGLIAHEFYKSQDGRLRVLIISLFLCKVWIYGGAAVIFMIFPPDSRALFRLLVLNFPMFCIMVSLYRYIKNHNS